MSLTPAIFGLIGVIIGGGINIAAAAIADRRRERTELRAAARLVAGELRGIRTVVAVAGSGRDTRPRCPETPEWDRWRGALARLPDADTWALVDAAYSMVGTALGGSEELHATERAIAARAANIAGEAVHALDRLDGRKRAAVAKAENDWLVETITATGAPPTPRR